MMWYGHDDGPIFEKWGYYLLDGMDTLINIKSIFLSS